MGDKLVDLLHREDAVAIPHFAPAHLDLVASRDGARS